MASEAKIRAALEHVAGATNHRFFSAKEEASTLKIWVDGLGHFSNEAVGIAAEEWGEQMVKFPTLVEISTAVRAEQVRVNEANEAERVARALTEGEGGARPPDRRAAVGKPGSEAIAAQIVLARMIRAVGEAAPLGYFGRLAGLTDISKPVPSARELGHTHMDGGDCERCQLLATVAYEQVILGPDSTATWEGFERPSGGIDLDALRRCINSACSHGWVSKVELDGTERLAKCETCDGPQGKAGRPKVMDGEEMVTTTKRRRRRSAW